MNVLLHISSQTGQLILLKLCIHFPTGNQHATFVDKDSKAEEGSTKYMGFSGLKELFSEKNLTIWCGKV